MTDEARVIQVVETTLTRRGDGRSAETSIRVITQYWSLDGKLLAEVDPITMIDPVIEARKGQK